MNQATALTYEQIVNKTLETHLTEVCEFKTKMQSVFKEYVKEFFLKNPLIKAVIWNQYAPYFNDGDACVFSVNDPKFTNAVGEDLENFDIWGEYEGNNESVFILDGYDIKPDSWYEKENGSDLLNTLNRESMNSFSDILTDCLMSDVLEGMFGSHASITATIDGFDVNDELEHD